MNNFTTVQELLRTPDRSQGQANVFQGSKTTSFDSKFKESPWRSRTSGNLRWSRAQMPAASSSAVNHANLTSITVKTKATVVHKVKCREQSSKCASA